MRVKLKLTDIRSGQESLLLVTNLNVKGLLVQAASTLPIGNHVKLHLQLEDGHPPLDLLGEIHKIALRKGGGRGMIIRFLDPPRSAIERISSLLARGEENQKENESSEEDRAAPSANRTMVVDLGDPESIPLRPPQASKKKKKNKPLSSTVDEEEFNQVEDLLGGDTRMLALDEFESLGKLRKQRPWLRWLFIGAFSLLMVPFLLFLGERLQLFQSTSPSNSQSRVQVDSLEALPPTPSPPLADTSSSEPTSLSPGSSGITQITIDSSPKRVEVVLTGTDEFADPEVEEKMSPRRLILRFPKLTGFAIQKVVPVSKNPLLRIRTSQSDEGVQMILDLYPVAFPKYELKKQGTTLTIYLYR